jgi:hypothetical protein
MLYGTMEVLAAGLALEELNKESGYPMTGQQLASRLFDRTEAYLAILLTENARRFVHTEATQEPAESEPA